MKPARKILLSVFIFCLAGGLIASYFSSRPADTGSIAAKIASGIQDELDQVAVESSILVTALDSPASVKEYASHPFFLYRNDSLVYWSDNRFIPSAQSVSDTFDVRLIRAGGESFIAAKKQIDRSRALVFLILLQRKYLISNDYLEPEWNSKLFPSGNFRIFDAGATVGIPVCVGDDCLFRVLFFDTEIPIHRATRHTALIFFAGAILALILLLFHMVNQAGRKYAEPGFLLLAISFFGIHWIMTAFNYPNMFSHTLLFDPQVFASSALNASLGDLFLNLVAVLTVCFYIFNNYTRLYVLRLRESSIGGWCVTVFSGLCILFSGLFPFVVIQTLYNNSSIVLDISKSLHVDGLRVIAFLSVMIAGICSFLFSHAFIRILTSDTSKTRMGWGFVIAMLVFMGINEWTGQPYRVAFTVTTFYFLIVYVLRLSRSLKRLSYATFSYLFISIFCLAATGAVAIQYFSEKEKIENQFRFASNFLIDRDYFGEYLLNETSRKITDDAFIQTRLTSPFLGKEAIAQKIRQFFLPSYFNKYDVEIFIFNAIGEPLDDNQVQSFSAIVKKYDADAYRTDYPGIRFINNPESNVTLKYLIIVPIQRLSLISGYVVVELSLKKIIPESVYPELLVDYRNQQFYRTQDLSYAVFANHAVVVTSGEFNYEKFTDHLGDADLYTGGISLFGFDHIAQADQSGRVAVVSTPRAPFSYQLANFSFLFVLGLFIILLMIFLQGIYNYFEGRRLFYAARIQLYLNLAFFIPLIIVSVSTLGLTSQSSQQQLDSEYLSKSRSFADRITPYLNSFLIRNDLNSFSSRLTDLAGFSNLDANIYWPSGALLSSTQPLIFENHLISTLINSTALENIRGGENSFIESEQIGKLSYFIAYTPLKSSQTGKLIGILGIPFFQSAHLLEKAQITILTNILNIFAFIFIALLILSYFVSEWLTFPLRFITRSLRGTSLTQINQPLTWTAQDEIGLMVKEYNSMLHKLSESKNQLEQTQREKAWREIAQQVAHEIKNPLTPMKLTLQQLERSLKSGNGSEEKSQKAIASLLSQVDTLNEIASSFSGFAKMPELVMKRLELVSLLKRTVDLHSLSGSIHFKNTVKEICVMGDEQLLTRTFSNLILNGLQSGNPGQRIQMEVSIGRKEEKVILMFRDNGKGIDASIADLVFLPHFSTKKTGSGLGLAIAKQGIEQLKGRIWFETSPGKGTSFYIELPVCE